MSETPIIDVTDVHFSYGPGLPEVLRGINLSDSDPWRVRCDTRTERGWQNHVGQAFQRAQQGNARKGEYCRPAG